jgi:stearoyl-CoA desaturase (delta-9 desaturase)
MFQCFGTVVTYHRYYSHKSFEFKHPALKWLFTYFGLMAGQGSPLIWSAVHKAHHKFTDTEKDPHSPVHGLWRAFVCMDFESYDLRTVATMARQKIQLAFHQYYILILVGSWALFVLIGLPEAIAATGLSILGSNMANYLAHKVGYTSFETSSDDKNSWIVALFFFGDGWHNNHHAKPTSYTTKVKWWEFDTAALVIKLVGKNLKK